MEIERTDSPFWFSSLLDEIKVEFEENKIPELPNAVWMDPNDPTLGVAKDGNTYSSFYWTGKKWRLEDNEDMVGTLSDYITYLRSDPKPLCKICGHLESALVHESTHGHGFIRSIG